MGKPQHASMSIPHFGETETQFRHPNSVPAQLAQKHQDGEGELQPSPVPEDIARESQVPPQTEGEKHQTHDDGDSPRGQNALATSLLLRRAALRWVGNVHGTEQSATAGSALEADG